MPRSTLPNVLSKMETMEVLITQTTEEEILEHMKKEVVGLEDSINMYKKHLNDLVNKYFYTNPYDKYDIQDWRNNRPIRKYKHDSLRWLTEQGEDFMTGFFHMLKVINDVKRCVKAFPEWETTFEDVMDIIPFVSFDIDELIANESIRYFESKKKYETEDAEFLNERKLSFDHREFHVNRQKYQTDDFTRNVLCNKKEPVYWTTCKLCIMEEQRRKDLIEAEQNEIQRIEEDRIRWNEEQKQKRLKKKEEEKVETYICECCNYKTTNYDAYDRHLETKEHKVKQNHADWFCKCCNIQSRSKNEHDFHLKSNKHQKNVNGNSSDKPEMYICKCCEYETPRKDLYNRHLLSKTHIKKANE